MPYYYNSNPNATPLSEVGGARHVSLSLKDLDGSVLSDKVTFDENYPANRSPEKLKEMEKKCSEHNLQSSYEVADLQERQYQQNVSTLLHKSSGSKYEEMIKTFLESKVRPLGVLSNHPGTPGNSLSVSNRDMSPGGVSLLESSVKLAERAAARQSQSALLRRSQQEAAFSVQQEAITAVLSQPLERNRYVPTDCSGTPTNLRGRQRAPPRISQSKSPINSTNKNKKTIASRSIASLTAEGGTRSVSVSIEDFNEWIESNKSWKEKVEKKKAKISTQVRQQEDWHVQSSPSLSSNVESFAQKSYVRKHSMSRGRSPGPSRDGSRERESDGHSRQVGGGGGGDGVERGGGMVLGELEESVVRHTTQEEGHTICTSRVPGTLSGPAEAGGGGGDEGGYEKDVFVRLYEEGRRYNDCNEEMDEHRRSGRLLSSAMSFSPRINKNSIALLEKRGRSSSIGALFRSCSPSSYRMSDISLAERQQHAMEAHRHRVRSVSPSTVKRRARESVSLRGSTISSSYLNVSGGKMYPERVVSAVLADGKVSDVLGATRSRSAHQASLILEERKRDPCHTGDVLSDGGQMYELRLVSKESKRINSHIETSFEDRMLKSMDEYRMKVKLNRNSSNDPTPGPGQYSNIDESNRCCPLPKATAPDKQMMRSKSPGAKSFSFGRTRRELL